MNNTLTEIGLISAGLDQPIPVSADDILQEVDRIIDRAVETGDPAPALAAGLTLIKASSLAGLGLVKLIYKLKLNWQYFDMSDGFEDYIQQVWGLAAVTTSRYVRIWEMFDGGEVPPRLVDDLQQRPLKDLVAISTAVASGYNINEDEWEELATAPDNSTVLAKIRDIKGVEPKGNSIILRLERDGTIRGYKRGEAFFVGYLAVEEMQDKPEVGRAVERIISGAGILRE